MSLFAHTVNLCLLVFATIFDTCSWRAPTALIRLSIRITGSYLFCVSSMRTYTTPAGGVLCTTIGSYDIRQRSPLCFWGDTLDTHIRCVCQLRILILGTRKGQIYPPKTAEYASFVLFIFCFVFANGWGFFLS